MSLNKTCLALIAGAACWASALAQKCARYRDRHWVEHCRLESVLGRELVWLGTRARQTRAGHPAAPAAAQSGSTSHLAVRRPAIKVRVRAEARPHVRPVCQPASLRAIEWHLTVPFYYGSPCAANSLPANTALELFSPNDASSRCFASSVGRTLNRDGTTSASCD
jgi:hypothetical protein